MAKNSLEKALDQVANLLLMTEDVLKKNQDVKSIDSIMGQLADVEIKTALFKFLIDGTVEAVVKEDPKLKEILDAKIVEGGEVDVKILQRLEQLKRDVEIKQKLFEKAIVVNATKKKKILKRTIKERKKKFRGVGGSKLWKKM